MDPEAKFKQVTEDTLRVTPWQCLEHADPSGRIVVNDIHSRLNPALVERIDRPNNLEELQRAILRAGRERKIVCVAGARHAMGGQQFCEDAILIDTMRLNRIISFDREKGFVEAEAGIDWVDLVNYLIEAQRGAAAQWGIAQKQTGADRLSLGGAVSANIHGRGLRLQPLIQDIEAVSVVNAAGRLIRCSRRENADLFRLVVGGYGLFGLIYSVTLRLRPRRKVERVVRLIALADFLAAVDEQVAAGCEYGDLQVEIDDRSPGFLVNGIFATYRPVDWDTPVQAEERYIPQQDLVDLIYLAHVDKSVGFEKYARYYLASSGQIYFTDTHQFQYYPYHYHETVDLRMVSASAGSEMITELYVPRASLCLFMQTVAEDFRRHGDNVIYSTIRLIEKESETFLAWASEPYACIIFNLHVDHTPEGIDLVAGAFRRLIDRAVELGGSYYLTYHRFATRSQLLACYPQFPEFLRQKLRFDPEERFQSDWYRHYRSNVQDS